MWTWTHDDDGGFRESLLWGLVKDATIAICTTVASCCIPQRMQQDATLVYTLLLRLKTTVTLCSKHLSMSGAPKGTAHLATQAWKTCKHNNWRNELSRSLSPNYHLSLTFGKHSSLTWCTWCTCTPSGIATTMVQWCIFRTSIYVQKMHHWAILHVMPFRLCVMMARVIIAVSFSTLRERVGVRDGVKWMWQSWWELSG